MRPLNTAERNRAFWRFLALFAVTMGLVAAVVFFSTRVAAADTRQLRQQVNEADQRNEKAERFTTKVRETLGELAKYETGEILPSAIHVSVGYRIQELNNLLRQMPNSQQSIYALSVQALDDLNKAKKRLSELKQQ